MQRQGGERPSLANALASAQGKPHAGPTSTSSSHAGGVFFNFAFRATPSALPSQGHHHHSHRAHAPSTRHAHATQPALPLPAHPTAGTSHDPILLPDDDEDEDSPAGQRQVKRHRRTVVIMSQSDEEDDGYHQLQQQQQQQQGGARAGGASGVSRQGWSSAAVPLGALTNLPHPGPWAGAAGAGGTDKGGSGGGGGGDGCGGAWAGGQNMPPRLLGLHANPIGHQQKLGAGRQLQQQQATAMAGMQPGQHHLQPQGVMQEVIELSGEEEEEEEEDPEKHILDKVGKISDTLRAMLDQTRAAAAAEDAIPAAAAGTSHTTTDDKPSTTTAAAAAAAAAAPAAAPGAAKPLVTRSDLVVACGPVAEQLKSYQLVGINFLMMLHKSQSVGGAILADEMGLGKTAQTISFLGALRTLQGNRKPHLIVCPSSLIQNWERELKRWCPELRVLMYHGKDREETREVLQCWRRRVKAAYRDGRITQLPAGVYLDEGDLRDEEVAALRQQRELEDDEEGGQEEEDEDAGMVFGNGLTLPSVSAGVMPFDVLLTTYSLFERDGGYQSDRAFLQRWRWSYMVADEAHALKNRASARTRKLRKAATACEHRILLTGTPLQNSLEELRALLELLMPSLFMDANHPDREDDDLHMRKLDAEEQSERVERYKALLAPFMLRRLKSEVATQLQSKKQVVEEVEMTPEQDALYRKAVDNMRREVEAAAAPPPASTATTGASGSGRARGSRRAAAAGAGASASSSSRGVGDLGSGPGSQGGGLGGVGAGGRSVEAMVSKLGSQRVSHIFTHLRKVSQHPLLVRAKYSDQQVQQMAEIASTHGLFGGNCSYERVLKEIMAWSDHQLHSFCTTWPKALGRFALGVDALMSSAKLQLLDNMLPKLFAGGSKVLLFSQWTMTLDLIEWYVNHKGYKYVRLDGDTQVQERLALVDAFNNPEGGVFLFLLSTRAGGQGLNLTGADVVVLHDVDFNPQVDRQAEDRCHRLGQTKPVTVYRLITKRTVDENILAVAERKLALDAAVLGEAGAGAEEEEGDGEGAGRGRGTKRGRGASGGGAGKGSGSDGTDVKHMGAILAALISDAL